jgi:signal transduction histidine kinase
MFTGCPLWQVLSNLLWNAVKYSDKQNGIIRLVAAPVKRKARLHSLNVPS